MATMVMTTPQPILLPASNGTAEKPPGAAGFHIDVSGLEEEAYEDACNQATPRKPKKAPAAELPRIFSSFKNPFAGPFTFGSNDPNASTVTPIGNNNHDTAGVQHAEKNGVQHQEDQNGATDSSYDTACNGLSEEDSHEKSDLLPVPEPQELLAGAFPPSFGLSSGTSQATAEDSNNNNNNLPANSHPNSNVRAKSPSRPSSPYVQGQDVHINCVQWNPVAGAQAGDAVVSITNPKGEYHEHHEQEHGVLNASNSHQRSQFLLTISAPSQSGRYEVCPLPDCVNGRASGIAAAGGAQLQHLLARVKHEKTVSRARAWEEGAKAKAYNRYTRDESKITAWENTMRAKAETRMRRAQESMDKQRAKHTEKMKNAVAIAHCKAQEKRAAMEARRAEDIVKAEEMAARIRATGKMPRNCLCFSA